MAHASSAVTSFEDIEKFRLTSPGKVLPILRSLIARKAVGTVRFNEGRDFILTTLRVASIEANTLVFDWGSTEEMSERLLKADRHFFVAEPQGVKVQFVIGRVRRALYNGRSAFVAALPKELVWLQRREYHRVRLPLADPAWCTVSSGLEGGLKSPVFDISVGGLCLQLNNNALDDFESLRFYPRCGLSAADLDASLSSLEVRRVEKGPGRENSRLWLAGCCFGEMNAKARNQLQRYIAQCERRQIAHALG